MPLPDILALSARDHADRPAAWFQGTWMTYGQLQREATSFAAFLLERGIASGDRVALLLENGFDYIVSHFGILLAGAVEVSLNSDLKASDLESLLVDCEAVGLVAGRKQASEWTHVLARVPTLRFVATDLAGSRLPDSSDGPRCYSLADAKGWRSTEGKGWARNDEDLASIVYTSGSTGKPKGVPLTHGNLLSNTRSIIEYLGLGPSDRMLVVLPFHYIYGRSLLYTHFLSGGSIVIDNRFAYPSAILATMEEQEATCFAGVPSTFAILLRKTDAARRSLPRLRLLTQAGGAMAPSLQREVAAAFPQAALWIMYGSTEASPRLTALNPRLLPQKWGSIGSAIPGVEVRIVDEAGSPLPPNAVGELIARGPNIMKGYWKDDEASAQVLRDGWYWTGDLGYADEDGCLFLTGRAREIIKSGGNRIGVREIEDKLLEIPGVSEAAVVGVADEILGEAIHASVVTTDPSTTEKEIRGYLRTRLPIFKQPKWIDILDEMPRNSAGKIMKEQLRRQMPSDLAANPH